MKVKQFFEVAVLLGRWFSRPPERIDSASSANDPGPSPTEAIDHLQIILKLISTATVSKGNLGK